MCVCVCVCACVCVCVCVCEYVFLCVSCAIIFSFVSSVQTICEVTFCLSSE